MTLGSYSFLPWLRRGIANRIVSTGVERASVRVTIRVTGQPVGGGEPAGHDIPHQVQIYGPGDVVGLDPRAIVRTDPRPGVTDFESNHMPFVELYDEDLPWRYTPEATTGATKRLRPWLALVVLTEDEFEDIGVVPGKPLPCIDVADPATTLPAPDELWAWAHVHVNRDVTGGTVVSTDVASSLRQLDGAIGENPDLACSRLLCPRRLAPSTGYHAFLVPTFETGRIAGLGLEHVTAPSATHGSWQPYPSGSTAVQPGRLCYYHRWSFRTGVAGDFESLVRLLTFKKADARVGHRDMDVQQPGSTVPGLAGSELGGVLRLGGALQVPGTVLTADEKAEAKRYEDWDQDFPHPLQTGLAALVNLADDQGADDPIVTPPLYGRWHSVTDRLLVERDGSAAPHLDGWVHELNLDPRFRVSAGFGTDVVQKNQEEYMAAAWEQIGAVLEANKRLRALQLSRETARVWHTQHLLPLWELAPGRLLSITAPAHRSIVSNRLTVWHLLATSALTTAPTSSTMRRILRPGGRTARALGLSTPEAAGRLVTGIAECRVTAAPPKQRPEGVTTVDDLAAAARPPGVPAAVLDLLARWPWLWLLPLLLAILLLLVLLLLGEWVLLAVLAPLLVGLVLGARVLARWARRTRAADALKEAARTPAAVDDLPHSPDFVISRPGGGHVSTVGPTDSEGASRYKAGLRDLFRTVEASTAVAPPPQVCRPVDVASIGADTAAAIDPDRSIPGRAVHEITFPDRFLPFARDLREVMAHPVIDVPMFRPLVDISSELFLPNIELLEQNSVTLLEANQPFIEAYMVGLNHEMARELLWREYPTDQSGSPFRQFWDVSSLLAQPSTDPEAQREQRRDIPPIHRWPRSSPLGSHDHREAGQGNRKELVLAIRGDLLKRYPTAVIYAHLAEWRRRPNGAIDPSKERRPVDLTDQEQATPPTAKILTPLYGAKVDPDISFFGFDLEAEDARGGTGEGPNDPAGWFFVIKERPGEPRFGLDVGDDLPADPVARQAQLNVWNDLAWPDVVTDQNQTHLTVVGTPTLTLSPPPVEMDEKRSQWEDDRALRWHAGLDAAEMAYILYQAPVLVAVHAREMLS